jgi:hypothetical protein
MSRTLFSNFEDHMGVRRDEYDLLCVRSLSVLCENNFGYQSVFILGTKQNSSVYSVGKAISS